jgi:transposase
VKQWENCLFTDESLFLTSRNTGLRVRRKRGEGRYDEKYTKKTFKHASRIMIWTSFSGKGGPGDIFFLRPNTTMTSSLYIKVLESHLTPTMRRQHVDLFFQDRATTHTAGSTQKYMRMHGLETVFLPSSSPDLNPIENSFSFLKSCLDKEDISSLPHLKQCILKHWKKLGRDYFLRLSHSMPRRLKEIVKNKGAMTKY